MIDRYVLPHIGRVPLRRLTITHLEDLYAHLRRGGRHDGGPLAPKTVLNVHQILRTALGDAERSGLVHRNVARLMDPPCHGAAPEQRCWNEQQLRQFLHVAMTHRLGPAIWLAAMTGMRRGQVLGMRWSDIDLDPSTLSIDRPRPTHSGRAARLATPPTRRARSRRNGRGRVHPPRRRSNPPTHALADRRTTSNRLQGYRRSGCTISATPTPR
jgi:integrase